MNKLITISIFLLSLDLYGADKPIYSPTGLEGFGKERGVDISIEDYSKKDKTFDQKAIKNLVELKLKLSGIKVVNGSTFDDLHINCQPHPRGVEEGGYLIRIHPSRKMSFKYNGKEYVSFSFTGVSYAGISPPNYRPSIDKLIDKFLLDYLKANPKKENK